MRCHAFVRWASLLVVLIACGCDGSGPPAAPASANSVDQEGPAAEAADDEGFAVTVDLCVGVLRLDSRAVADKGVTIGAISDAIDDAIAEAGEDCLSPEMIPRVVVPTNGGGKVPLQRLVAE